MAAAFDSGNRTSNGLLLQIGSPDRPGRVLSADWERVYGHAVHFAETFVDPERFRGTCYRAANWIDLGQTLGRGKNDLTHRANRPLKDVLGYP